MSKLSNKNHRFFQSKAINQGGSGVKKVKKSVDIVCVRPHVIFAFCCLDLGHL